MGRHSKNTSYAPSEFRRPCLTCGTPSHYAYCREHLPLALRSDIDSRLEHERAVSRLRRSVLKRDNYTCVACGVRDKTGRTLNADHIIAWADGGPAEKENLQTLCKKCHRIKTTAEMAARKKGNNANPMK